MHRHSAWQRFNRSLNHPAAKWVLIALVFLLGLVLLSLPQPNTVNLNDTNDPVATGPIQMVPELAAFCLVTATGALLFFAFKPPKR
jgi:polyferredoxin